MRGDAALARTAGRLFDDLAVDPVERDFAATLVRAVTEHGAAVDEHLGAVTRHWRLDRIGAIERSVLRLGAAELAHGVTPPRVVLQECVRLAERFGGLESARFVNGVLDALARRMGRL
jgi:N utilization substance protein B